MEADEVPELTNKFLGRLVEPVWTLLGCQPANPRG